MPVFLSHAYHLPLFIILGLVVAGVIFIGIGKAGLGGGVGLVSPVLMAQAMPMRTVLSLMLPLLIMGDAAALWPWWKQWDLRNLWLLLPGSVGGLVVGAALLATVPDRTLGLTLAVISLVFVVLQVARGKDLTGSGHYRPLWWHGALCGLASGFCSMLAHGAGPIVTLFLMPQGLGKERFVATTVIYFACLNLLKLPFFIATGMLTRQVWLSALWLTPVVILGTVLGVWLNRGVNERVFAAVVYAVVVLTSAQLLLSGLR